MVLSPVCPTSFNVRPYGTTPTQDNMLSPMAQAILNLEKLRMNKEHRDLEKLRMDKERRDEEEIDAWERQRMYYR